ncbi:hypothetical protein [Mesorhizobium sp. YR577]|uniref:hypothetical protein n=1 Tax=Mesorhizobium sp. YR577 TaxID=1884373 RepID=UPI0008E9FDEB|nr:hypothetical protein [Mesorhizobium sp. YR577]SFU10960.1 hypothetical protein SAMN05518861_11353 [Mesorhizobium sp. YR577]
MSDASQAWKKRADWEGLPSQGTLLPLLHLRSSKQEDETRQVVKKDLQGYCPAPSASTQSSVRPPFLPGKEPGAQSIYPWQFQDPGQSGAQPLVFGQTPLGHQNTMLSNDAAGKDLPFVKQDGDPKGVAKEAESRPPNIVIKNPEEEKKADDPFLKDPKISLSSKGQSEEGWDGSRTRYRGGESESKGGKTSTYEKTGKPFDGKYTFGGAVKGPSDSVAFAEGKDTDGLAQGSYKFGHAGYDTKAGLSVSDDWAGGNANITAEAGAEASAGVLKTEGSLNKDGIASLHGSAEALTVKGSAKGGLKIGTYEGSPTATLQGKLGAEAVLVEVKGRAEVAVTPYRAYNPFVHAFNGFAKWAEWDARLSELDKSWDWGIFVELGAGGSVGASAGVEGEAGTLDKGKIGLRGKGKAVLGVGGEVGLGLGVKTPEK